MSAHLIYHRHCSFPDCLPKVPLSRNRNRNSADDVTRSASNARSKIYAMKWGVTDISDSFNFHRLCFLVINNYQ